MPAFLFYLFAAVTLGFGLNVVLARNPVTCALSLAMSFVGLAALFISLDAYFIGIIQILVYTGAVMVLFLFIIMLLDIKHEEGRRPRVLAVVGGGVLAVAMLIQVMAVLRSSPETAVLMSERPLIPELAAQRADLAALPSVAADLGAGRLPDAKLTGLSLFGQYGFHMQVVALLLVVGTVGVVMLSTRERAAAVADAGGAQPGEEA
jgi:NADH-quinone oxidoreductase subunit J